MPLSIVERGESKDLLLPLPLPFSRHPSPQAELRYRRTIPLQPTFGPTPLSRQSTCETTNATTIPKLTSRNRFRATIQSDAVLGTSRIIVTATPPNLPGPFSPIISGAIMHNNTASA